METMGLTGTYTTRNMFFFRFTIKYGSQFNATNQTTVSRVGEKKAPNGVCLNIRSRKIRAQTKTDEPLDLEVIVTLW